MTTPLGSRSKGISRRQLLIDQYEQQRVQSDTVARQLDGSINSLFDLCLLCVMIAVACAIVGLATFSLRDVGGFLQGTTGILLTFGSIALLTGGMLGTQKQLVLAQSQNALQHLDFLLRNLTDEEAHHLAILDRALDLRITLLQQVNPRDTSDRGPISSVNSLLRWLGPYVSSTNDFQTFRAAVSDFVTTTDFCHTPYVEHLRRALVQASELTSAHSDPRYIDHVWSRLFLEERVLALVLRVADPRISVPSGELLQTWESALQKVLPWNSEKLPLRQTLLSW